MGHKNHSESNGKGFRGGVGTTRVSRSVAFAYARHGARSAHHPVFRIMACVNTEQSETLDIGQPSVELGQLLIALCEFRSATNLLCLNHAWAALAKEDITWRPLATTIAREARLHFDTSHSTGEWRTKCRRLFSARGTFVSECFGAPTPAPERAPFHIAVGCRFRPPGGTAGPAQEVPREVVLPLHQRLQFIAAAHNCTLAEARKRL